MEAVNHPTPENGHSLTFSRQLEEHLKKIRIEEFSFTENEVWMYQMVYDFIWEYANAHHFLNTLIALPVVRSLHDGMYRGHMTSYDGVSWRRPYFCHCLSVCRMLINLNLPLSPEDEDIALTSALCHDLKEIRSLDKLEQILTVRCEMDPRVMEIIRTIYDRDCQSDEDYQKVFDRVQQNRIALLMRLSDRGNVVEELYNVSIWKAHELIHETRTFYLPMCIYAREHYPELDTAIGILQEKIREMTEATEIFVNRYEARERELTNRILQLQEENARMRIIIRKKKEAKEN